MKTKITEIIKEFVKEYEKREAISTRWNEPLVGFADAHHPYIAGLKTIIGETHSLPENVISNASIVVVYFLPFTRELADTNRIDGERASLEWARSYEETNALFPKLNEHLISELRKAGYRAAVSPEAAIFDRDKLVSGWSHRHFAKAAGLGTFGLNNMLITKAGCCGRFSTIVTNLDVEPDLPLTDELCLFKKSGKCGACARHCPAGALTLEHYDRHKCYEVCMKNARRYTEFGNSYSGGGSEHVGSEVCGKCIAFAPCAFLKQ